MFIYKTKSPREIEVAFVNSKPIYLNEYNTQLMITQMQIEQIIHYARSQGLSEELFLALSGLNNPKELALNEL